jgi:hypothetical protein
VAQEDNEENALTSLRIIFELHKAYRNHDDQVKVMIYNIIYELNNYELI